MKKLLVLALVLGMASMASATLQISVNGDKNPVDSQIVIMPSDELILDIWTNVDMPDGLSWALAADITLASISGGDYVGGDDGGNILGFIYDDAANMGILLPAGENGVMGGIAVFAGNGLLADATLYDGILFHCAAEGDTLITLYLVDDSTGQVTPMDSVLIHQIPEPATMLLLGLGGLFLRRRK